MRITVSQVRNQTPILDVGCGSGLISKLISTNLSYIGIDFNPNYVSRDWKGRRVDGRLLGNIMRLPFRSGAFRAVLLASERLDVTHTIYSSNIRIQWRD